MTSNEDDFNPEEMFSREQIEASYEIINTFINDENGISWALLLAQMQSGKTETYLLTACELMRLNIVNTIVIFSGNREIDLCNQIKKETEEKVDSKFYQKYNIYLEEHLGILTRQRNPIINNIKKHTTILWGSQLNKYNEEHKKTCFIWEESHYAQSIGQCPDKFLKKIGIPANGDNDILKQKENRVISVSATPFSEVSDYERHKQSKKIVHMKPGNGYNSVKDIITSGHLKSFKDLETGLKNALSTPHNSPKYAIIRISNKNENTILNCIAQFPSWTYVIFDSITTGDAKDIGSRTWQEMKNAPKQDTIILIRGKCRMGKNLEKKHVLFVMETAKNSNTDTVLQGLLGRVCGYSEGSRNIDVYIHDKITRSEEIQRYIKFCEGELVIPRKACNIIRGESIKHKYPIIPFIIKNTNINGENRRQIINYICEKIYDSDFDFGRTDNGQFNEIRSKIRRYLDKDNSIEIEFHDVSKNLKVNEHNLERILKWKKISKSLQHFMNSDDKYPMNLWFTGIDENKSNGVSLKEGRIIHLFYYSERNEEYGIEADSVFVYGVTDAQNPHYVAKSNIPETTKKEVFAHSLEDGTDVIANGGYVIHLPLNTYNDVSLMKEYILQFTNLTTRFPTSRSVTSQWDGKSKEFKGILVNLEVKQSLLPGGAIYEKVISDYGFEIKLTETNEPINPIIIRNGWFKYSSISW